MAGNVSNWRLSIDIKGLLLTRKWRERRAKINVPLSDKQVLHYSGQAAAPKFNDRQTGPLKLETELFLNNVDEQVLNN